MTKVITIIIILYAATSSWCTSLMLGEPYVDIVVAAQGGGDYETISEAIGSLPMFTYERVVILIKAGTYHEKIRIEQDYITLVGEDRDKTIIEYSQPRPAWVASKDAIGPAVVNIHADDIILKNLTIRNTQPDTDIHAFAIYGTGTRMIMDNCTVTSNGGDTVSLWNYKEGMYYHSDCRFEGAVDFVCPRGWCYIRDSEFYAVRKTAALWHAATTHKSQKLVIVNSTFDGADGYSLGRHHYDAQFIFMHCIFSENMQDRPIYRHVYKDRPEKNRPDIWGDRYYFHHCTRIGGQYDWISDNLADLQKNPEDITAKWTFAHQWDPENTDDLEVKRWSLEQNSLCLYLDESVTIRDPLVVQTSTGKQLSYVDGRGRDIIKFSCSDKICAADFEGPMRIISGGVVSCRSTRIDRSLPASLTLSAQ